MELDRWAESTNSSAQKQGRPPKETRLLAPEHLGRQLVVGVQPRRPAAGLAVESRDWEEVEGVLGCPGRSARSIRVLSDPLNGAGGGGDGMSPTVFPVPLTRTPASSWALPSAVD